MIVKEYNLKRYTINKFIKNLKVYKHQKQLFENYLLDKRNFLLLTATGSGKTVASVLPIIYNNETALFIYPTNALIDDQFRSIKNILCLINKNYHEINENNFTEKTNLNKDYFVIKITGDFLDKIKKELNMSSKGDALKFLITNNQRPVIFLTNPDILFLLLTLSYRKSTEILSELQKVGTIVFDEFHTYFGLEFVNIISSMFLSEKLKIGKRKIFLSATPDICAMEIIKKLFNPEIIASEDSVDKSDNDTHTVLYHVELIGKNVTPDEKLNITLDIIFELKEKLILNRKINSNVDYIPLVVIFNSVVDIIKLEDLLLDKGFPLEELCSIRGLMDKNDRKISKNTLIVLGTSAIEIGIDFSCDYLIFEAITSSSFLQRFGRIGRHKPGIAYLLGNYRESEAVNEDKENSREDFSHYISGVYDKNNSFSWFIKTELGLFIVYCQFNKFIDVINKDKNLLEEEKEELIKKFDNLFMSFVNNIIDDNNKIKLLPNRAKQFYKRRKYYKWPEVYIKTNTFRSSLESKKIYVKSEEQKKRNPSIDVDIISVLKKSKNLLYNSIEDRFEVDSFTEKNLVTLNQDYCNEYCEIKTTNDDEFKELKFKQNDHLTPLSHYINLKDNLIIFLPKECIRNIDFDWRFQAIYCQDRKSIAVIGNNALLLKELFKHIDKCQIPEDNFL